MSSSTIAPTVKSTVILIKRVVVGTLLSVGFAVVVWFDSLGLVQTVPGVWLIPVALAAAFVATEELLRLFETRGIMPKPWLVRCGVAIVVLSAFVDHAGIHAQGGIGDVAARSLSRSLRSWELQPTTTNPIPKILNALPSESLSLCTLDFLCP